MTTALRLLFINLITNIMRTVYSNRNQHNLEGNYYCILYKTTMLC